MGNNNTQFLKLKGINGYFIINTSQIASVVPRASDDFCDICTTYAGTIALEMTFKELETLLKPGNL